jgi:hypothetical protein
MLGINALSLSATELVRLVQTPAHVSAMNVYQDWELGFPDATTEPVSMKFLCFYATYHDATSNTS